MPLFPHSDTVLPAIINVESRATIVDGALVPVQVVTVGIRRSDFGDPDAELVRLRAGIADYLSDRAIMGQRIVVELEERR